MVSRAKGRFFRRKDGKYFIYIPRALAGDSMFPFKGGSVDVEISFKVGDEVITVEELEPNPLAPQTWKAEDDVC